MTEKLHFTTEEREQSLKLYTELRELIADNIEADDEEKLRTHLLNAIEEGQVHRDTFDLNPILTALQTAKLIVEEIGLRRDAVMAVMLRPSVEQGFLSLDDIEKDYGQSVARILHGLERIQELYRKNPVI